MEGKEKKKIENKPLHQKIEIVVVVVPLPSGKASQEKGKKKNQKEKWEKRLKRGKQ